MGEAMNTTDYPAAHSMDTEWWAVDAAGEVALFDSEQEGACPSILPDLSEMTGPEFQEHYYRMRGEGFNPPLRCVKTADSIFSSPLCLDSSDPFRYRSAVLCQMATDANALELMALIAQGPGTAMIVPCADASLVRVEGVPEFHLGKIFERVSPVRTRPCRDAFTRYRPAPGFFGIWEYYEGEGGEYVRGMSPEPAIQSTELPEALRAPTNLVVLRDIRFSESPFIQPVKYVPCRTWRPYFADSASGVIRAVPGKEE